MTTLVSRNRGVDQVAGDVCRRAMYVVHGIPSTTVTIEPAARPTKLHAPIFTLYPSRSLAFCSTVHPRLWCLAASRCHSGVPAGATSYVMRGTGVQPGEKNNGTSCTFYAACDKNFAY